MRIDTHYYHKVFSKNIPVIPSACSVINWILKLQILFKSTLYKKEYMRYKIYHRIQQQKMINGTSFHCKHIVWHILYLVLHTDSMNMLLNIIHIFSNTLICILLFIVYRWSDWGLQIHSMPKTTGVERSSSRIWTHVFLRAESRFFLSHIVCFPFFKVTLILSHCENTIRNAESCNKTFCIVFKKFLKSV